MQVGGAFSNVIVRAELPSAAGHGVSPVIVAPAIVLGSGVNVVVGALGSSVVVEPSGLIVVVVALVAAPLLPRLTAQTIAGDADRDERDQQDVHAGALALLGPGLTGEIFQALLAIGFLTFTFRGSHEQVRLAGGPANTVGSRAADRGCRVPTQVARLSCRSPW